MNITNLKHSEIIIIKTQDKTHILRTTEIIFLSGSGSYTSIHLEDSKTIVSAKPLKHYEGALPYKQFFRCHKSFIINLSKFKEYLCPSREIVLSDIKVPVSKRRLMSLLEAIMLYKSSNE